MTPIALPQGAEIEFEPRVVLPTGPVAAPSDGIVTAPGDSDDIGTDSDEIYEILSRRYRSGYVDTAARVDELDP